MTNQIDPQLFLSECTKAVVDFRPIANERYENRETGRIMHAGDIAFQCGHTYTWRPWGLRDDEPMPAPGVRMLCAVCVQTGLESQA